ncbi:MAG: pimeloyl-ACP methyl ester carboxylesterase [Candidatus Azotimanducaceae bacterium]|jgi:pimeloyl-ACP methyl ester carboxylesterase
MENAVVSRPGRHLLLAEAPRTAFEFANLALSAPFLGFAPRGDGHPVLVMPGLGGSDLSTAVIRGYLDLLGYKTFPWALGRNLGPAMPNLAKRLGELLTGVFEDSGERKVSLVGWSLGGVYARLLAQMLPDKVRSVATLGSPFSGSPRSTSVYPLVERLVGMPIEQLPVHHLRLLAGEPLQGIPSTAVFSKTDAIVPWQIATQAPSHFAENIEVFASHTGLGLSPAVLFALADRLQHAEGEWRPFQRTGWKTGIYGPARLAPVRAAERTDWAETPVGA